ncbi:putative ABC transporter permease protein [Ruminiclostridium hungatei]|uniref:Putative ABC transporter permease protein n=1 Tax=Ruminiclostridium hungatei TaxID=48256 RepID=A0A1V4SG84_RUMHU|nr:iron ABC transporter permease [Ruminiclostridium hungatei]OPX42804.1 putative ABC transporter permease protein [Ruminiclostridium hungatei]
MKNTSAGYMRDNSDIRSRDIIRIKPYFWTILTVLLLVVILLSSAVNYREIHPVTYVVKDFALLVKTKAANLASIPVIWEVQYSGYFQKSVDNLNRSIFAVFVGAALAAAGAAFQGLFKNPVVSPSILGVSSGASVGVAISIMLFNAYVKDIRMYAVAFAFGFGCVLLVLAISSAIGRGRLNIADLLLVGTVVSSFFNGIFSIIVQVVPRELAAQISSFLLGAIYAAPEKNEFKGFITAVIIGLLPLILVRYRINILSFGDEEAMSQGINPGLLRVIIILCGTVLVVSTVLFCGIIGWVGLVIPHIGRMLAGPDFKTLLPVCVLAGAIFMLIAENMSMLLGYFPLGIITSIIGAPLFFYLLAMNRREQF